MFERFALNPGALFRVLGPFSLILLCSLLSSARAAQVVDADVCVYGGTSGGAMAAVQAARLGKSAVLVNPERRVGGMTSGGLGHTDTGNTASIGGLAREFYRRVGKVYGGGETYDFE